MKRPMATIVAGLFLVQALPGIALSLEGAGGLIGDTATVPAAVSAAHSDAGTPDRCGDGDACTAESGSCVAAAGCPTFAFLPIELAAFAGSAPVFAAPSGWRGVEPARGIPELPTPPPRI